MPKKIAATTLNASTLDILNVIRQNASLEYQNLVPKVASANDIPKVGEVIYGYPAMANQFLNALINRIALVRVNSLIFNNPYRELKKGFLEYGETVEEIFVNIAKVRTFDVEKAAEREFQRSLPDVQSAFHVMNWRVQYPVTIQDQDLKQAFLSMDGVQELIAKIVDAVYRAADYDEFLLFKYILIKAVSHGEMAVETFDGSSMDNAAIRFRSVSNLITFPSTQYNQAGVLTSTPRSRQYIFMDSAFNASYDVSVLAAAFNMDKADFMGRLLLIDHWDTFDNTRFMTIQEQSNMLPPITEDELAVMKTVRAVLVDEEWFQIYDNHARFTEKYVGAGEYWNYFYNVWKTISHSPFSNAVALYDSAAAIEPPASITAKITGKETGNGATMLSVTLDPVVGQPNTSWRFVQTEALTKAGISVQPYGLITIPDGATGEPLAITNGTLTYVTAAAVTGVEDVGEALTFAPAAGG